MKALKIVFGSILLVLGAPIILGCVLLLTDPETDAEDRVGYLAVAAIIGGPIMVGAGLLYWSASQQDTQERQGQRQKTQDQVRDIFFELLQQQQGRITVLQLAMAADIPGEAAKLYLDGQIREFGGDFEVSDQGTIIYLFPL